MSIFKRKLKNGYTWRAVIRIKGYPTICETFERKQEAEDWEKETKNRIKQCQFKFDQHKKQYTFKDLVDRYVNDGALEHHRSADDTLRHLNYWRELFGKYALVHLTSEFLGKERQCLLEMPTHQGKKRTSSTVNRYLASLSACFTYAVKQLRLAYLKETKNGRPRSIPLEDPVIEELKKLYQTRDPHKLKVFASRTAFGRLDPKKSWNVALKKAGISQFRFHDLRHTFATLAAKDEASNMELQTAMAIKQLKCLLVTLIWM